ncbi:hypothetical protein LAV76_01895 [Bacillus paramobilis]|uniref:RNA dependent RNA polymerase n=1 Tax=Bacillus paramobilis TaxID=2817477 RepID=UPI0030C99B54
MTNKLDRVLVYSVNTDSFFNNDEKKISQELMEIRIIKKELSNIKMENDGYSELNNIIDKINSFLISKIDQRESLDIKEIKVKVRELENKLKERLYELIEENKDVRSLRRDSLFTTRKTKDKNKDNVVGKEVPIASHIVALFESTFTRTLELDTKNINESVIIVKSYHYKVLKDLIKRGFTYNGKAYTFFSSSSGQMKNKKCVFIKEDLWDKHKGTFLCGLDKERINNTKFKKNGREEYGININKYLAYLSLQNTATTKWKDFDIDKVIVCPDLEVTVTNEVEFIDRDRYKISDVKEKTLPMNVSDGVGLILPELSDKNFQFRIPWGKGLLSPFDFKEFAKSNGNYIVEDVWGNKHHIIKDDIRIILSASQLKTWRYYKSMKEYRAYFKGNNCEAGKCNEEVETKDIHLNYQYLQTLTDMSFEELKVIAKVTNNDINRIGSNKEVMLRSLGATEENKNKNYFQQALCMYNNLLNDSHAKEMIKSKKKSMVKDACSGALRVEGKRMFVLPDLYAYCEFLFTGNKKTEGLLEKGQVFAKNIREGTVDVLRSPQLYREHGVRENVKDGELEKWFKTGALYCNNKDYLSRLLQMDFDGDQVNVCSDKLVVNVAKRNMEGIVPLYYEMSTAPIQKISNESIYKSLELSFNSSIGVISNDITKIWNSGDVNEDKLEAIKLLTMYNNFMIDYAKTNFLPKPTEDAKKIIKTYTQGKMPYFFQFAKNKKEEEVAGKLVGSHTPVVNMLEDIIKDRRIVFKSVADNFDYKKLLSTGKFVSKDQELDKVIIQKYNQINRTKKWLIDKDSDEYKENKYVYVAQLIKEEILDAAREIDETVTDVYVADVLVYHLHSKQSGNKKTLWESFGDILVLNLKYKLEGVKGCKQCSGEFKVKSHKDKYCSDECKKNAEREKKKVRSRRLRMNKSGD